ncbi:DUF1361 domain-containing protein [Paenibacillus sp. MER TA 81-3]|uniref:DUF1361 domain-containing protein n=1 Tax=Paenibacillus sp. MER TA 81-3 TaxID=2939573 RepID=UPI00203C358E|nr:DUF1361 domain-containing protein [Paenibacillus sp. MER TA 81-3]MCM3337589.1 DUF1361 domain-containing protein [Paenibacillus sp. MER TA 81-3]
MDERAKARLCFFAYILMLIIFDTAYSFMILNMFLAFAALELAFLLPLFKAKSKREIPVSAAFYIVFILLSPNVLYVITDLIHLKIFEFNFKKGLIVEEWWNFFVLISGVVLAIYYYILMLKQIHSLILHIKWSKTILLAFIILCSIGVYIGRFLRFHSIHLFAEPFSLVSQVLSSINGDSLLFIGWMSMLQFIMWWLFSDSRRNSL